MVQEEEISKNTEELVDDQNVAVVSVPPVVVPTVPPQLPLLQQPVFPPPLIPSIAPIPRPLAPLPVRVPTIRPPPKDESNEANSDSGEDELGLNKAMEYEISEESKQAKERHEKAVQELLMKRRAFALAVPTNDSAVRARLRRLGEPITLFGEREMERRDRLRTIMLKLDTEGQLDRLLKAHEDEEAAASAAADEGDYEGPQTYPFYTEGSKALADARTYIAKYSLVRAATRLERARRRRDDPDEDIDAEMNLAQKQAGDLVLDCSEIGDDRPLTDVSYIYKNQLQIYAQKRSLKLPLYTCVREGSPHSLRFKATVTVDGQTFESPMFFRTLKEAEHAAAKAALCSLSNDGFQKDDCGLYKNLLQDLTGKEGFSTPVYTTSSSGASHEPTFTTTVEVEGDVFHGEAAKTKKQAEINAAKIAYFSLKERQLSRVPAALFLNGDAEELLECIYPNFVSSLNVDLQKNLNLDDTDVDHGAAPEELLSNRGTSKISHSTSQLKPETGSEAGTSRSSSSDNVSEPLHVPVPRVPSSQDGSSSPTTVLECSNLAVAEPNTDKTAKECALLCNRVVIYPRKQGWRLPEGASMLPISDDKWVAVSLDYPS